MTARQPSRAATRDDVARHAGVSAAVVSYVVNDGPRPVADATRSRVLQAIKDLGYRPNAVARSLRGRSTRALGLLVPDNSNPFFAELARVIEDVAFSRGYTVLLGNAEGDDAREQRYVRTFLEQQVEGILLISCGHSESLLRSLEDEPAAVVLVDRALSSSDAVVTIEVDNEAGGYAATRHLIDHGHRSILCFAGPTDLTPAADRYRGWLRAMQEAGLRAGPTLVARSPFDRGAAYPVAHKVLSRKRRPTAVFAATDQQAIAVLRAAADLGLTVPEDLAVIGFDGIAEGAYTVPRLASVRQPMEQMGRRAVEAVLENPSASGHEIFPVALAVDESCGCARPTR